MKNPFEGAAAMSADRSKRERPLNEVEQRALQKAQNFVAMRGLKLDSFRDFYPEGQIEADKKVVASLKERFARTEGSDIHRAAIFEALFCHQAIFNGWLGKEGTAIKTSQYDDYVNFVDAVAEFSPEKGRPTQLALAIDVTFGAGVVAQKLEKVREEILRGNPTEVKYFHSKNSGVRGPLKHVPRAVIGVEHETLADLTRLWMKEEGRDQLALHPAQKLIAEELAVQMDAGLSLARNRGSSEVIEAYERAKFLTQNLFNEKRGISSGEFEQDRVYRGIIQGS